MTKLTKGELARRKIREQESLDDGALLGTIFEKWGPDAWLYCEAGYYDDSDTWYVVCDREETDEEYQSRIDNTLAIKVAEEKRIRDARKKRDDEDRKTYERLRKKFEKN